MKICVLNGSPKGMDSVTMQYVRFLELAYPEHTFVVENIGQRIAALTAKDEEYQKVIASIDAADAILFATPVYVMLVPAQLKRFIELLFSHNARPSFFNKFAASITTSIHFFDHTANEYLHAIAEDLGMHWAGSFMAGMNDLLGEDCQEQLLRFGEEFFWLAEKKPQLQRTYPPLRPVNKEYQSAGIPMPLDCGDKKIVILTDAGPGTNLERMTGRLASLFGRSASIVPLDDLKMKGGCLGCCACAFDNTCVYTDGFCEEWETSVLSADIIILAGTVKDRYFSAEFKQVFDRSFYRGHVPAMTGKTVGILAQGPFSQCSTLREVLHAEIALQGAALAGTVTDEEEISFATDGRIDALALRCLHLAKSGYVPPAGFPVIAGMKIFRDAIWSEMRPFFRADHAYYRKHGLYDFPQNDYSRRIKTSLLGLLLAIPQVRKQVRKEMKQNIVRPLQEALKTSRVLRRRARQTGAGRE
jgi:multimeric flavodoxin WrbA